MKGLQKMFTILEKPKYLFILRFLTILLVILLFSIPVLNTTTYYPDHIEINNKIKLTINPGTRLGRFVLYNSDMKMIVRNWHLRSRGLRKCTYMAELVMNDGQVFSIERSLEKYLISTVKIPAYNTNNSPTINCFDE